MAKKVQNPNLAQRLVQAFTLKGPVTLGLDEIVVPVVIAEDLTAGDIQDPKYRLAIGGIPAQVASGAGNQWHFGLINPAGSGVTIRLTALEIELGTGGFFQVRVNTPIVNVGTRAAFWRDANQPGTPVGQTFAVAAALGVLIEPLFYASPRARIAWSNDTPGAVLPPNSELTIIQNTANDTIATWFVEWVEVTNT